MPSRKYLLVELAGILIMFYNVYDEIMCYVFKEIPTKQQA